MTPLKEHVTCIMVFFHPILRCHTCLIFITTFTLFPQNSKLWNEKSNGIIETATGFEPTAT